jgi:uncharacterized protein YecT (DUF1311 family)
MSTDPIGQSWAGGVYHGFAGAPPRSPKAAAPQPPAPVAPPVSRRPRAFTIGLGVAAALALGLGLGFLTRPHLAQPAASGPMRAVTPTADSTAAASEGQIPIQLRPPPPLPPVRSAGKLEVLPPELARSAPRAPAASAPVQLSGQSASQVAPTPVAPAAPISPRLADVTPPPAAIPPPAPQVAYGYGDPACAGARGRAAQMVCGDPDLAAADRELNRAYRRAMRSGAMPPEQLRQEQRDWLSIREDAARRSPRAVASIYEQRIDELNQLADDGPG